MKISGLGTGDGGEFGWGKSRIRPTWFSEKFLHGTPQNRTCLVESFHLSTHILGCAMGSGADVTSRGALTTGMLNNRGGPAVVVGEGVVRVW